MIRFDVHVWIVEIIDLIQLMKLEDTCLPNKAKEPIVEEDVGDNLFDMVNDLEEQFVHRPELFEAMMNDVEMPLYDGCSKYTKLSALVKLWNMKASGGWTNSSFTALLEFLREVLPVDNKIPA
ncbi:hypothetical protein TIFTF001_051257, partial [Ficus carica]